MHWTCTGTWRAPIDDVTTDGEQDDLASMHRAEGTTRSPIRGPTTFEANERSDVSARTCDLLVRSSGPEDRRDTTDDDEDPRNQ